MRGTGTTGRSDGNGSEGGAAGATETVVSGRKFQGAGVRTRRAFARRERSKEKAAGGRRRSTDEGKSAGPHGGGTAGAGRECRRKHRNSNGGRETGSKGTGQRRREGSAGEYRAAAIETGRRAARGRGSGGRETGSTWTGQRRREGSAGEYRAAATETGRWAARGRDSGSGKGAPENTRTGQPHQKRGVGQQGVRMSGGRDRPHRAAGAEGHRRIQGRISPSGVRPARRRRSARTAA